MRVGSAGRRSWAPMQVGAAPVGGATILTPTPSATVRGIILLSGLMPTSKPITAVEVRYDSASYRPATWRGGKWRTLFNTTILSVGAHTLSVRVTYNDASTVTASVPITVGASTMIPGIAALKLGSGFSAIATNRDKYTNWQINEGDAAALADVITRPTIALTWMYGTTIRKSPTNENRLGIDYDEATAKGWVQKTSGGADVEYPGDPGQVFVKFGDPAYIARVIDRFVNHPNTIADSHGVFLPGILASQNAGIDGAMCDDTNASYSAAAGTPSATYPTSLAWRDAMFLFLKGVGAGLQDAGYLFGCNPNSNSNEFVGASGVWPAWGQAHDDSQLGFWVRAMAPYVDVIMKEYWMTGGGGSYRASVRTIPTSTDPNQYFREALNNAMNAVNESGTSWLLNMQVGLTADNGADDTNLNSTYNQARMKYMKAAMLLKWDPTTGTTCDLTAPPAGGATVPSGYGSNVDPWNLGWTKNMGLPLGPMTEPVVGGFLRRYENGNVYLNGQPSSSVTFPAPDNLVVPAKTAVIT